MKSSGLPYTDGVPFPGEWRDRAACRDADPELFFAVGTSGKHAKPDPRTARAKMICRGCCVRDDCLGYALAHPSVHGTWGGLTEQERVAYRKSMRAS